MTESQSSNQYTVDEAITWHGRGLHSGLKTSVTVAPADTGFGIKFRRIDTESDRLILSDVKYVSATDRSTDLTAGGQTIGTVEHILAAIWGAGITNAEIRLEGGEVPILDGSAAPFYNLLLAHKISQEAPFTKSWAIEEVIEFEDEASGASYTIIPSNELSIDVVLSYNNVDVGGQNAQYKESEDFSNIADARTFVLTSELEALCERGLIKGGDLDNAVLISSGPNAEKELSNALALLERTDTADILKRFNEGHELKHPNELARHKILDLIGDLSLLGHRLQAKIIATRPGHTGNAALAKHLKPLLQKHVKLKGKPLYDPTKVPIYDTVKIMEFLPHRYPLLLVDKIIDIAEDMVVGVKNITFNEALFQGHFPGNPIFPGVLQMEALAQTGGILALLNVEKPSDWDMYFIKMNDVKFKKKVFPGDTLILKMQLLAPIRRGIVNMQGTAYVGDSIVSEGELTAQIIKRN